MRLKMLSFLLVGCFSAILMLAPRKAEACHNFGGGPETIACFSALYTGVAALVFAPAEVYYATKQSWLPPAWAWTQLFVAGVLPMVAGATAIAIAPFKEKRGLGLSIGFGTSAVVVGGWFLAHSILSLRRYRPPSRKPTTSVTAYRPRLRLRGLGIAPIRGGAIGFVGLSY